jgi:hypothetical protein
MPLLLVLIEAAPLIGKPFSKCGAFHLARPWMIVRDWFDVRTFVKDGRLSVLEPRPRPVERSAEDGARLPAILWTETESIPILFRIGSAICGRRAMGRQGGNSPWINGSSASFPRCASCIG